MSSAAGKAPAPGQPEYSASKYALNGYFHSLGSELCQKGIKVTVVCPGTIETSNSSGAATSEKKGISENRVSLRRCVELTIIAATHGLKEAWISYQPVLAVMYLVQHMSSVGYWLMDKLSPIFSTSVDLLNICSFLFLNPRTICYENAEVASPSSAQYPESDTDIWYLKFLPNQT